MAYDPYAPNQAERESHPGFVWASAAISAFLLLTNFVGVGPQLEGMAGLIVGTLMVMIVGFNRFDDYLRQLSFKGFRAMIVWLGLWFALHGMLSIFEGYYPGGLTASGYPLSPKDLRFALPPQLNSAWFVGSVALCVYHAVFLITYHRGRA